MQSVSFRDLQNIAPSTLRKKLTSEGKLLLTVNNQPIAVMISLYDENTQDIVLSLSHLRAQMAVRSIRSRARREGLDKMPLRDINVLIKKTRAERKA